MFEGKVIEVFIASPSDVKREREILVALLNDWNIINSRIRKITLKPLKWETDAYSSMNFQRGQENINQQLLTKADILIGIFWTRIGTPTGEYLSGTIEEIEKHKNLGKPVMLFFSNLPIDSKNIIQKQYQLLKKNKNKYLKEGLIFEYDSLDDFKEIFNRQFGLLMNNDEYIKKITQPVSEINNKNETIVSNIFNKSHEYYLKINKNKKNIDELLDELLNKMEKIIVEKYHRYIINSVNLFECKKGKDTKESVLYSINFYALVNANKEINKNIRFLYTEGDSSITTMRLKPGLIAGIIIYHLSKYHIIHISDDCLKCQYQCFQSLSENFSIRCGLEYIGINYLSIPENLRQELIYAISKRNVSQESLGFMCLMLENYKK
jgi:hypothetical protein